MAIATTPLTPARQSACEETFLELEQILEKAVRSFILKHGMSLSRYYDEMYSDALVSFMDAYEHYTAANHTGTMPFVQYLRWVIKVRLIDHIVRPGKKKADREERSINTEDLSSRDFNLQDMLDSLSSDGQKLTKMILDSPRELATIIADKGAKPIDYRTTIRKHLREIGWTAKRIRQTFLEVKEVL